MTQVDVGGRSPYILFVDHEDSFSGNLVAGLRTARPGRLEVRVVESKGLSSLGLFPTAAERAGANAGASPWNDVAGVVLSPGPGHPADYPESQRLVRALPDEIPTLGVCLGHQLLLFCEGARIRRVARTPVHGRRAAPPAPVASRLLDSFSYSGKCVLFNSLACAAADPVLGAGFDSLWSHEGDCLVAEHARLPRLSVQYHPESFGSPEGQRLLDAFVTLCLHVRSRAGRH